MDRAEAQRRANSAPVAHLGTIGPGGRVDLVPCTFALDDGRFVTAVDHKPKTTTRLRRLANVLADPRVAVLIDHYDDQWDHLWWVRIRGEARVLEDGPDHAEAVDRLAAKYPQYRSQRPRGPAIVADITHWQWWSARG